MQTPDALRTIAERGIVPVVAVEAVDAALPLADALLEGGLPIVEVTFRTAAAAEVIGMLVRERPELLVGAGTVLTEENLQAARDQGAHFAVAPGFNPRVAEAAQRIGLLFVPGVCTPTDIERALEMGCRLLKFFPAEASGGLEMIKALAGPYRHAGARFLPTGGVTPQNLEAYVGSPDVAAVGGTWLARSTDLAAGRFDEIRERCREAVAIVSRVRGGG